MIRGCDIMAGDSGPLAVHSGILRLRCAAVAAGVLATIGSVLSVYPHQLAYFNEASGGPQHGHRRLLHSNLDWGQSLLEVRDWLARNATRRPVFLAYHGDVDPAHIGITDVRPVSAMGAGETLPPGWYLVSHNFLWGSAANARDGQGPPYQIDLDTMAAIRSFPAIESLGYAIAVVHVPELR
jgi:hypothetical protein